jgi:hypothetical protein
MKKISTICTIILMPLILGMSNCGGVSPEPAPVPDSDVVEPTCENACKANENYCGDWCDLAIDVPGFVERLKCVVESSDGDPLDECP